MCSCNDYESSKVVLVGIPYDGTCSFRPGTRFAPSEIRIVSNGIEEYSPISDRELEEVAFFDAGDLDLPFGNSAKVVSLVYENAKKILNEKKKVFAIGGEHLVSLGLIRAYFEKYPNLHIVHFDAHADLRESYLGEELSHATVIRRCLNFIDAENLVQFGIRSGTKEEFSFIKEKATLANNIKEFRQKIKTFEDAPVYITVDLDVLDPSILPGTGTPEPGGLFYNQLIETLLEMQNLNVVGCDIVELSPHYDPSNVSTIVAAKLIREMLLMFY